MFVLPRLGFANQRRRRRLRRARAWLAAGEATALANPADRDDANFDAWRARFRPHA